MGNRYQELVIRGPAGRTRGFIEGVLFERGHPRAVREASEEGLDCETLRERVRELLHPSAETLHLLVPDTRIGDTREAVAAARESGIDAELVSERPIQGARFRFDLRVYSPVHGKRIRGLLEALPDGVRLSDDTRFEERHDPEAAGVEEYAPVHEYELRADGSVEGDLDGVISIYRTCRDEELIHTSSPELVA